MKTEGTIDALGIGHHIAEAAAGGEPVTCTVKTPMGEYSLYADTRGVRLDRFSGDLQMRVEDVAIETGSMTEADMLRVLAFAVESGVGFLDAAVQVGRLSQDKASAIAGRVLEEDLLLLFSRSEGSFEIETADAAQVEAARDPLVPPVFFEIDKLISGASGTAGVDAERARIAKEFFTADADYVEKNRRKLEQAGELVLISAFIEPKSLQDAAQDMAVELKAAAAMVLKHVDAGGVKRLGLRELKENYKAAISESDTVRALAFIRRAFEVEKFDNEVLWTLGGLFEMTGEKDLAAAFFEFDGALHASRGDEVEAGRSFEKVGELDPGNRRILERLFEYRLSSGSMRKAVKTGTVLAAEAVKGGDLERAEKYFDRLLAAAPEDFGVRVEVAKARLSLRDIAGMLAQVAQMEKIAERGFPRGYDASSIRELLEEGAKLDPGNEAVKAKLEAYAPKQVEAPKARSRKPMVVMTVALLTVAGGGAAFFFLSGGSGGDSPAVIGPGASASTTKRVDPRAAIIEEAKTLFLAGDVDAALAKYARALESGPTTDQVAAGIRDEIKEIRGFIERRRLAEEHARIDAALSEILQRPEGPLAAVDKALAEIDSLEKEAAAALAGATDPEGSFAALGQKAAGGRIALLARRQNIHLLAAQNEWDRDGGTFEEAARLLDLAAAGPDADTAGKASSFKTDMERYMKEAQEAHTEAAAALSELRAAGQGATGPLCEKTLTAMRRLRLKYPRSPLSVQAVYPVLVVSNPAGAHASIAGTESAGTTPTVLEYRPLPTPATLSISRTGYAPRQINLDGSESRVEVKLERMFIWSARTGDSVECGPALSGEMVFVGCRDGGLYSFKWSDSSAVRAWAPFKVNDIGGIKCRPLPWRGRLVVSSATLGEVWGLDLATGDPAWGPIRPGRMIEGGAVPIPDTPFILIGDLGGTLFAVNSTDGKIEWKTSLAAEGEGVHSTPAVYMKHGAAFVGTTAGAILKTDLKDGSVIWRAETGLKVGVTPLVLGDLAVAAVGSKLMAFDARSPTAPKKTVWEQRWIAPVSNAVTDGARILVCDQSGSCFVLDPVDGKQLSEIPFGGISRKPVTPLPVAGGLVLAGGNVITYWRTEGPKPKMSWSMTIDSDINDPLVCDRGVVLFTTADGRLSAATLE